MIENYEKQIKTICHLINESLQVFQETCLISYYEPEIIKSGVSKFDKGKIYLDTSSVEGINNILEGHVITYSKRPSRANMQPKENSVWFAKMKGSNKILIVTNKDSDLLKDNILSTGFLGINATNNLPLSLLVSIIISSDFLKQRDLHSVGTTMAGVNNDTFLRIQVPFLQKAQIAEYDKKYSPLIFKLSHLRRKIVVLKQIKSTLLKKYF